MSLTLLALAFILLLSAAYRLYGGWIARQFSVSDENITPANKVNDGIDFVPTRKFYLFAQHFSAIAAAGPIAGPIIACQAWGWVPCLLWISLGVVLIGAVHDFSSLTASVRHGAKSIAEIAREHLGPRAGLAMMAFIWIALVYVIISFTEITASSFTSLIEELDGIPIGFNAGGAVAAASMMYLLLAVLMGLVQKFLKPPLWIVTAIFVPATLFVAWLGTQVSTLFLLDARTWGMLILAYCAVASVIPVWSLLQPRGYLGGFVLFMALGLGVIGVLFGGYEVKADAFKSWDIGGMTGTLFPFLFVTIACGACSGFHGLVCSGTTSKQVDRESHMQTVGYGGMLAEGFVALIALVTIMVVSSEDIQGMRPGRIYGNGIGQFLTIIIGKENLPFAITFGAMAFSTFVFDTLDVSTRLGRYILQELFGWRTRVGAAVAAAITISVPAYILAFADKDAYVKFWTLFGSSNQLLAALSLLAITVWLYRARKRIWFTLLPMLFVLTITLWSLVRLTIGNIQAARGFGIEMVNALAAVSLILLSIFLVYKALVKFREKRSSGVAVDAV